MEQQSVLTQTTRPQKPHPTIKHRWMFLFFTDDTSPDNLPIVELQRRVCWLALALFLQSFSQMCYVPQELEDSYPILYALLRVLSLVLMLGSFVTIYMAFRPSSLKQQTQFLQRYPRRWQRISLALMFVVIVIGGTILALYFPPPFGNDGTSLDANAADLLLQGRNPYTDSSILDVARHFQIQPNWTTPLQQGQFANQIEYPTTAQLQAVMNSDLQSGNAPEFESQVSYPSLSFLTLVPFAWLKEYNVVPFYVLCYLLLIAIAWKMARPELRAWVLLLAIANIPMWSSTLSGNLDLLYTLFIVLAWLMRDHRWRSSLFLGLAVASKQIAWFFVPFYLIMAWRHYGLPEAIRRLVISGCIALALNLPFILWNPQAWLSGVMAPVADPMFPLGLGLIDLSIVHLVPFFPGWVYIALECSAMLLALGWYWRICRTHPEAAMLLAVAPLMLAWRSLPSYFFCMIYPIFTLLVAKAHPGHYSGHRQTLPLFVESKQQRTTGVPAPTGLRVAHVAHFFASIIPATWPGSSPPPIWQESQENGQAVQHG